MEGQPLAGIKVVELSMWAFVPSAAAVLADWGAEVLKIEDAKTPDPIRGLQTFGVDSPTDYHYMVAQFNRGKRSIGLDLRTEQGYAIFLDLIREADVFVTSFLEPARRKLRATWEDLSAVNPRLIYARGHGQGQRGPDAEKPGFDGVAYWSRAGVGHMLTPPGGPFIRQRPAIGDVAGGMFMVGGICAALYQRSVTGKGSLIDTSLLAAGMWVMAPDILASAAAGHDVRSLAREFEANPLTSWYGTSDDRYLNISLLDSDRYWAVFCTIIEREDLRDDPRFATFEARARPDSKAALAEILDDAFRRRTLEHWARLLSDNDIPWAPVQTPFEVSQDGQALLNGYISTNPDDPRGHVVAAPCQFDNALPAPKSGAPEFAQHTEELLLERGFTWEQIIEMKDAGVCA